VGNWESYVGENFPTVRFPLPTHTFSTPSFLRILKDGSARWDALFPTWASSGALMPALSLIVIQMRRTGGARGGVGVNQME
jgi:hypothetical protein